VLVSNATPPIVLVSNATPPKFENIGLCAFMISSNVFGVGEKY